MSEVTEYPFRVLCTICGVVSESLTYQGSRVSKTNHHRWHRTVQNSGLGDPVVKVVDKDNNECVKKWIIL